MNRWVEITFDCIPLRSLGKLSIPDDASPKFRRRCEALLAAAAKHGALNSYYLVNGKCAFHLVNHDTEGLLEFTFEGTVLTDAGDVRTVGSDLRVELARETCDWINAPVVEWFAKTVDHAVRREFDRYIEAGDLQRTFDRLAKLQAEQEATGGYVGMYL